MNELFCLLSKESFKSDPLPVRSDPQTACVTRECIGASYRLLSNMNASVDPCDDFYQVAKLLLLLLLLLSMFFTFIIQL